jgi:capsular exopolysaccharide synthesis family protein
VAKQRQQAIEKQLADAISMSRTTNSAELTMQELQGKAKGYRTLYETFLQRYMGSTQQESFPIPEARLISPAAPPPGKSKPKSSLILALGVFGGFVLGLAAGLLRDAMDRVFRTSSQLETELRLRCLSLVPRINPPKPRTGRLPRLLRRPTPAAQQRTMSAGSAIYQAIVGVPLSRFVESIYAIKLAIDLSPTKTSNKVVGITSSLPDEGKSTVAATLAHLIGLAGKKVIIVDCDLRNPSLSTNVAPSASAGIVEVAAGLRSLEETVWSDPKTNVVLLPATRESRPVHTSDILASEQTKKLFDRLRAQYDYIIVDLPPLSPIVDVRATTPLIDCFVLVVEWGQTKIDVVQHALHTAPDVYDATIGAVLNKTNIKAMRKYDNYRSDYYSNKYYGRYGLTDHY